MEYNLLFIYTYALMGIFLYTYYLMIWIYILFLGRTALHIAVLKESEEIVDCFVNICPEALKIGDNVRKN